MSSDKQPTLIERLAVLPLLIPLYLFEWYCERQKQKEIEELNEKIHDR